MNNAVSYSEAYKSLSLKERREIQDNAWEKLPENQKHNIEIYPGFEDLKKKRQQGFGVVTRAEIITVLAIFLADHGLKIDEAQKKYKEQKYAQQIRIRNKHGGPGQPGISKGDSITHRNVSRSYKPHMAQSPKPYRP